MNPTECPNCGANLDGGPVPQEYVDKGYYREGTRWSRVIGISDLKKDRIVAWLCPDCDHQWERKYPD